MKAILFYDQAAGAGVQDVRGAHTEEAYRAAARIRAYEPMVLPGPLQHPAYAEAIQRWWAAWLRPDHGEAQHEASVAAALATRQRLADLALGTTDLDVVIEEAALRTLIGSPAVMRAQLARLLELAGEAPRLTLAVIPAGRPRAVPPVAPFWLIDGGGHIGTVAMEVASASLTEDHSREFLAYARLFDRLRLSAVAGDAARRLIEAALAEVQDR